MGTIGVVLLIAFIIVCVLLVLLVLVQDDGENGMGGLLGGRGTAAFGSHSANVLTKTTFVLVILFFAFAILLALVNKKPRVQRDLLPGSSVETSSESESVSAGEWWTGSQETDSETEEEQTDFDAEYEDAEEPDAE